MKIVSKSPSAKRLADFPDLYELNTDGTWTVFAADGPRYKALGNSMATVVMGWIGRSIARALEAEKVTVTHTKQIRLAA